MNDTRGRIQKTLDRYKMKLKKKMKDMRNKMKRKGITERK